MKISVVGTGYVGLVTGTCLSDIGHSVVCVDTNDKKIELLKAGKSPIYEPGLESLMSTNIEKDRLTFTTDLAESLDGADAVFIAVNTPESADGSADLSSVWKVAESLGSILKADLCIVVKSTVPVGTCDRVYEIVQKAVSQRGLNIKVDVASNPEFLQEGRAIQNFKTPDRIIVGIDKPEMKDLFNEMYRMFVLRDSNRILYMSRKSAELTKYASNAMLATRISFMNELSRLSDAVGANIDEIRQGMGYDERIGKRFLYAGPGYGGSCFPKDVAALGYTGRVNQVEMKVIGAAKEANESQKLYSVDKIRSLLNGSFAGKRITVWGAAFKPETDDVRESPAITIVERILAEGGSVRIHDPKALDNFAQIFEGKIEYCEDLEQSLEGSDAVALVTEWVDYRSVDWKVIKAENPRLFAVADLRNQYNPKSVRSAGLLYCGIGRGNG